MDWLPLVSARIENFHRIIWIFVY